MALASGTARVIAAADGAPVDGVGPHAAASDTLFSAVARATLRSGSAGDT